MWATILTKWVDTESGWAAQTAARRRMDSFFTAGLGSEDEESKRQLRSMGTASFWRVWMIVSSSSMAIWWVSLSESLERELRIRCFSSTMAKWDEREDEVAPAIADDDDGGLGVVVDDGWVVSLVGFADLGPCVPIFVFCPNVSFQEMNMGF